MELELCLFAGRLSWMNILSLVITAEMCAHFCKWKGERYFAADDILITSCSLK